MSRGVISSLRDLLPIRPLTRAEALAIAERQANRLIELSGISAPPVPETVVTQIGRLKVEYIRPFPASGATHYEGGRWVVVINAAESKARQKMSLAHELKHAIDDRFAAQLYGAIDPGQRHAWAEQVCDYFAGCLYMPRTWLEKAWDKESQNPMTLAELFGVSRSAMEARLNQIGLYPPEHVRAAASRRTLRVEKKQEQKKGYMRPAPAGTGSFN